MDLRYGENPHQQAALYGDAGHGRGRRASSFTARSFPTTTWWTWTRPGNWSANSPQPAAAIIKHTNPCGCAEQATLAEAYRKALECDPVSAYGGVIGFNRAVDEETAREMAKIFIEAIAAPDFTRRSAGGADARRRTCG